MIESHVNVIVRLRSTASDDTCIEHTEKTLKISGKGKVKEFTFDTILGKQKSQAELYDAAVSDLIKKCLDGYNGCIFCYGQTGSGKTYTMQGPDLKSTEKRGMLQRVAQQITEHVNAHPKTSFTIKASYMEIYQEKLYDLLVPKSEQGELRIRQDPESLNESKRDLFVEGITERSVYNIDDYLRMVTYGAKNRVVGETNMNEFSSRSHAVFTITIEERNLEEEAKGRKGKKRSKIHLIDLAGSERADATGATDIRLKEGSAINLSLSALGNVINALTIPNARHVPYRDSKLTYLLSDSLGGNSLTLMITCVNPTTKNFDETLSTLRFAERAKLVKNHAKVNIDKGLLRIMELEAELARLRGLLMNCTCGQKNKLLEYEHQKPWWRRFLRYFRCGSSRAISPETLIEKDITE